MSFLSTHVLIVDDEPDFRDAYEQLLQAEGYQVVTASNGEEALARMREAAVPFDVVILDQRLQGSDGPDSGLDLLGQLKQLDPAIKVIIATGWGGDAQIERAFKAGAYDYLAKGLLLGTLLKIKIRNAVESNWRMRLARAGAETRSAAITQARQNLRVEADPQRRGRQLEELTALLMASIPGFEVVERQRSLDEEIDLLITNKSPDLFWTKQGTYFLVECRYRAEKSGPKDLDAFASKLQRRFGQAKLGFFISMAGFTEGFHSDAAARRQGDTLIIPLDATDLDALIASEDRSAKLQEFHRRAALAQH